MGVELKVLDHGSVELVETWGSDERIIEAARMSTGKGFKGWGDAEKPGDEKLLRYLWEHKHATPFEMAGAVFEVKAPIFVFREWHRHRTQSYNEMSGRYIALPDENYLPSVERILAFGGKNKQAQGTGRDLSWAEGVAFQGELQYAYKKAQEVYENALGNGVPKELARLCLPVARYSKMRASANLRNWLGFLDLRAESNAQWEIQQYAYVIQGMLAEKFPRTLGIARP